MPFKTISPWRTGEEAEEAYPTVDMIPILCLLQRGLQYIKLTTRHATELLPKNMICL